METHQAGDTQRDPKQEQYTLLLPGRQRLQQGHFASAERMAQMNAATTRIRKTVIMGALVSLEGILNPRTPQTRGSPAGAVSSALR